jgi:hypothetical protein
MAKNQSMSGDLAVSGVTLPVVSGYPVFGNTPSPWCCIVGRVCSVCKRLVVGVAVADALCPHCCGPLGPHREPHPSDTPAAIGQTLDRQSVPALVSSGFFSPCTPPPIYWQSPSSGQPLDCT